jgi:hypothetical protein
VDSTTIFGQCGFQEFDGITGLVRDRRDMGAEGQGAGRVGTFFGADGLAGGSPLLVTSGRRSEWPRKGAKSHEKSLCGCVSFGGFVLSAASQCRKVV